MMSCKRIFDLLLLFLVVIRRKSCKIRTKLKNKIKGINQKIKEPELRVK